MQDEKKNIQKELESIAPELDTILQKHVIELDDAYFYKLNAEILEKTVGVRKEVKKTSVKKILLYTTSLAAAFVCIYIGIQLFQKNKMDSLSFEQQLALFSSVEIETLIEENIQEFDAALFIETEYVSDSIVYLQLQAQMQNVLKEENGIIINEEVELDASILETISDEEFEEMIYDESLFEDIGI